MVKRGRGSAPRRRTASRQTSPARRDRPADASAARTGCDTHSLRWLAYAIQFRTDEEHEEHADTAPSRFIDAHCDVPDLVGTSADAPLGPPCCDGKRHRTPGRAPLPQRFSGPTREDDDIIVADHRGSHEPCTVEQPENCRLSSRERPVEVGGRIVPPACQAGVTPEADCGFSVCCGELSEAHRPSLAWGSLSPTAGPVSNDPSACTQRTRLPGELISFRTRRRRCAGRCPTAPGRAVACRSPR
jgi:hypothetical protein